MWQGIEARLEENNHEQEVPLRKSFLAVLRHSAVRPGESATKKMVALEFGSHERLVWQIEGTAQHFYLHQKWQSVIEAAGFPTKVFPYQQGAKDGGRHSALSRDWSFGTAQCFQVKLDAAEALQKLLDVLLSDVGDLHLNPAAVTRWIERLRQFFPGLERFDKPDPDFDARERDYKLEVASELRAALESAATDQESVDAIHSALAKSNLLAWRAYWPMSPKGDADREKLWPALATLGRAALGEPDAHAAALDAFVVAWMAAVPKASSDAPRQIAEFLFMHLAPDEGVYIRNTVRQNLWLEAVGSKFPVHASMAETYAEEQRFMRAVRRAFEDRELSPRDMIDVQSALWVIHNYTDEAKSEAEGQEIMTSDQLVETPSTTNLILYGPPGTGKTYATAWEAVRLCAGDAIAASLRTDRDALMAEYRRLVSEGRIEFVTFHQSFSYEDFVEGLRPTTQTETADDEQGELGASSGFSLKAHAGVFKIISERARLDTGDAVTKRLDRSRRIYKIALGQRGSQEERILEGLGLNQIHLGWGGDIDWSDDRFDDFEEIRKEWNAEKDPDASGKDPNIEITYAFRSGLQIGDSVVISDGRDSFRAFGKVEGEYEFDSTASTHPHRRRVEWIWRDDNGADRAVFYSKNFRRQSAYRLDPNLVDWDALETIVIDPNAERPVAGARSHVLIIDEINRANISKVFGELITLLEVDKRLGCENEVKVRLPYSGSFGVPSNLHIIGTMNTADRSIALLDTALRRRFTFRELMPDISELRNALAARGLDAEDLGGINLCKLLTTINGNHVLTTF